MNQIFKTHIQKTINLTETELEKVEAFFTEERFKKRKKIIKEND